MTIFILVIDATSIEVSINALVDDLNTNVSTIQSIFTIFTLVKAAFFLIGARLQNLIGRKRTFLTGLAIYGIGVITAAVSQNATMFLVGWSILEGIGAVMVLPATVTFITGTYEGKDRSFAFGVWGGVATAASIFGLIFGGFLTTFYSWRWAFTAELIILLIIFALHKVLKETHPTASWKSFDLGGAILSVLGLMILISGILLIKDPARWSIALLLITGGIILLSGFYLWERRQMRNGNDILANVTIIHEQSFLAGSVVAICQKFITSGFFFIFILFLEMATGATAYETGIALLPISISIILFSILGARLASFFEPKYILLCGIAFMGAGLTALKDIFSLTTSAQDIIPGGLLFGLGLGIVLSQVTNLTISSIRSECHSDASGMYNTVRQLGNSLGTAIIGLVLALGFVQGLFPGSPLTFPSGQSLISMGINDAAVNQGMEWAFIAMILVVIGMFIASLFIRKTGKIV
jgi:MFS family permease